jgi:hypothetical protein
MYVIRVEFPDEDKYAYVTEDDGGLKYFRQYEDAVKEAKIYEDDEHWVQIIERQDDESIPWSI